MAIQFSCSECGKNLHVRDESAGRKCRCPGCGKVATVPSVAPPLPAAVAQSHGEDSPPHSADGTADVRRPKRTGLIIVGIVGVIAIGSGFVGYRSYSASQEKKKDARERLTRRVDEQVGSAVAKGEVYDFRGAEDVLRAVATEVEESPYAEFGQIYDLNQKIDAARYDLERREIDHRHKLRTGWVVKAGRLISPAEQQRVLAEKKRLATEEAKRLETERQRVLAEKKQREAEEAKRKEEERRLEEIRRKAAEEARAREVQEREAEKLNAEYEHWLRLNGLESYLTRQIGDLELAVGWKFSTVYVSTNGDSNEGLGPFFNVGYMRSGVIAEPAAGFVPVDGKPEKVIFSSSNPSIVTVNESGNASFKAGGNVTVTVKVASERIRIPIKVVEVPVYAGRYSDQATSAEEVIKLLGMPDEKEEHYVSWPDTELIDGIFYSADPGRITVTEHWKYKKYPGAVIAIVYGKVSAVGTYPTKH